MAFTSLTAADLVSGKPVKQEICDLIRTNLDDLDSRVTTNTSAVQNFLPITFTVMGGHWKAGTTGLGYFRVPFDISFTDCNMYIPADGSSGTTTVDIQKSAAGGGSFSSIFSAVPTINQGGGAHQVYQATLSTLSASQGDILRFDLSGIQVGSNVFYVYLNYEVA